MSAQSYPQPQQTQPAPIPEEVIFVCPQHPDLELIYEAQVAIPAIIEGKQTIYFTPEKYLAFRAGVYRTTDPKIVKFIRENPSFTGVNVNGMPVRKTISEAPKPDMNQIKMLQYMQKMGTEALVNLVERQYGIQPGLQVQDPVAATVRAQQGVPVNANNHG